MTISRFSVYEALDSCSFIGRCFAVQRRVDVVGVAAFSAGSPERVPAHRREDVVSCIVFSRTTTSPRM